jgi:hypothetical protein
MSSDLWLTAWARDEPPSPQDQSIIDHNPSLPTEFRPSDVPFYNTSVADINSRWWSFTRPRPVRQPVLPESSSQVTAKPERKSFRDISWLHTSSSMREGTSSIRGGKGPIAAQTTKHGRGLSITLPASPAAPYTISHNATSGWDSPWSPRTAVQGPDRRLFDDNPHGLEENNNELYENQTTSIRQARKKFRAFILTNTYVPLVSMCPLSSNLLISHYKALSIH